MNVVKEQFVAKKNELIEGISDLELLDLNLINMVIAKIDSVNHEDLQTYIFTKKEIVDFLKLGKNYRKLDTLVKTIPFKKVIVNTDEKEYMTCYWFHSIVKKSTIEFRIDPKLKPYLIKLSKDFTKYELALTRKFKSKYSFKFYEWFLMKYNKNKKYKNIVQLSLDIDMLKSHLFLSASYINNFHLLNKRVVEPSISDINIYTDLDIRYVPVKTGVKVKTIDFFIKLKENNKNSINSETKEVINLEQKDFETKKSAKEFFNKVWDLYPVKKNISHIKIDDMIELQKLGYDVVKTCIDRYVEYLGEKEKEGFNQGIKNGDTFFLGGYVDYLDENYTPYKAKPKNNNGKNNNKPEQSTNFEQRQYDDEFFDNLYDNF